jgi:hypothetical protein
MKSYTYKTEQLPINMIYLTVPFKEKEIAKWLGAKWDRDKKLWYTYDNNPLVVKIWGNDDGVVNLNGELRDFGGSELFVDLIPKTCWFSNVRSCVVSRDWDKLRKHVYTRANNKCECCGTEAEKTNMSLEAHERWEYDEKNHIQKLVRLVALCHMCHNATHMGRAGVVGKGKEAKQHLAVVRGWTDKETDAHVRNAFTIWLARNKIKWELDLTLLTNNGISLVYDDNHMPFSVAGCIYTLYPRSHAFSIIPTIIKYVKLPTYNDIDNDPLKEIYNRYELLTIQDIKYITIADVINTVSTSAIVKQILTKLKKQRMEIAFLKIKNRTITLYMRLKPT